jgi:hypothetical protein
MISDDTVGDLPQGVSILIASRSEIGELRIETHQGRYGSGDSFCMHVRHDGNRTLIILEPAGEWIT